MTRVVTGSRLHFGLLHVPIDGFAAWPDGTPVRKFGGVGLTVRDPEIVVRVERAAAWDATGPHADRAVAFARAAAGDSGVSFRVAVDSAPPDHVGLGTGTQLGMAVGTAVARELGLELSPEEVAARVGRGGRSGVGVRGFAAGGLLVDGGKRADGLGVTLARFDFPPDWPIVLARPRVSPGCHGDREKAAFARPRTADAAGRTTERLCRLVLFGLLPALAERDFPAFGDALTEFNRAAGEPFAADQGGVYASPEVDAIVSAARGFGVRGVGQSSWGPTTFAVCRDPAEAAALAGFLRTRFPDLADVTVTAAKNTGATVE